MRVRVRVVRVRTAAAHPKAAQLRIELGGSFGWRLA